MTIITAAILGIFILVGWLSYIRYLRYQFNVNNANARFNSLLDKLGNNDEFLAFLQSAKGRELVKALTSAATSTKVPILVMISSGIIFLAVGLGGFFITAFFEDDFIYGAVMMSAIGAGFLSASLITLRLSRKWGIFETDENGLQSDYLTTSSPDKADTNS